MAWSKYHTSVSKPVVIRGVRYPSLWQAAKSLGCHPNNISKALKEGWLDRAGIKTQARKYEHIADYHGRDGQLEGEETNADC
jgi:DNA-binding transcriptional regulator YhcF (GntR family)